MKHMKYPPSSKVCPPLSTQNQQEKMKRGFMQCPLRQKKKFKRHREFIGFSLLYMNVCFQSMLAQSIQKGMWTPGKLLKAHHCCSVYSCITQIYKIWTGH